MIRRLSYLPRSKPAERDAGAHADGGVRASLGMRVHGGDLDPARVTSLLQFRPDYAARKGEVLRITRTGNKVLAPTGTWYRTWRLEPIELLWSAAGERWFEEVGTELPRRLAGLPDASLEYSLLLAGEEVLVAEFLSENASHVARALNVLSRHAEVDIDLPTLGRSWTLPHDVEADASALSSLLNDLHLGPAMPRMEP